MMRFLALFLFWPLVGWALPDKVVLVGVTDYATEVGEIAAPLAGPGNDVALMAEVLLGAGVPADAITVLTDRPGVLPEGLGSTHPARGAIIAALDKLARQAKAGDEIAIFLAGHGAQIPAASLENEPDGLDEAFLPADFSFAAGGFYQNTLRDDDIGARIDRMIAAGAHVWLIADTCHSGSLRRSDGAGAVPRFVDFGHPSTGLAEAAGMVDRAPDGPGSFVGFYAAAAGSLAFEVHPREAGQPHGSLTWALAQALRQGGAETYRQLAVRVAAGVFEVDPGRADPRFSGALAKQQMLAGGGGLDGFALSITDEIEIAAGRLDGLGEGALVALHGKSGVELFRVRVAEAWLTRARAALPKGPTPGLDAVLQGEKLDPGRVRFRWLRDRAPTLSARVLERSLDLTMRVSVPEVSRSEVVARVLAGLAPYVRVVKGPGDVTLEREGSRVYIRPAGPGAAGHLSVPVDPDFEDNLAALLRRVAKARALLAAGKALAQSELADALKVVVSHTPGEASPDGCLFGPMSRAEGVLRVSHCDQVTLTIENKGSLAVDLTPLYVAADRRVYYLAKEGASRPGWRIEAGANGTLSYREATRTPEGARLATGPMQLLLLAVEARPGEEPADFSYLQDSSPPARQRAGASSEIAQLLDAAGFGLALTRSIGQHALAKSGAVIVPIETVADEGLDSMRD